MPETCNVTVDFTNENGSIKGYDVPCRFAQNGECIVSQLTREGYTVFQRSGRCEKLAGVLYQGNSQNN